LNYNFLISSQSLEGKSLVAFQMQGEVVASAEAAIAVATFERLCSSVFPVVARQLIRPGESPFAAIPTAAVGLLACVRPLVGFQV
jgi:hypothetical protein